LRDKIKIEDFWKPIEECPKAFEHYYLLRHYCGIIAAKWGQNRHGKDCWRNQFDDYFPEHITHFAEIPPLPDEE